MDEKDRLIELVQKRDISAIQVMASELLINENRVRELLDELVTEGKLKGYITQDGQRFFRKDIEVVGTGRTTEDVPEFLRYNTAPGKFLAFVGIVIMIIAGGILSVYAGIIYYENLGVSMLLIGLAITFSGCYYIGRRKTPM